ncbi:hypothetical protein EAS68_08900 [Legionella jordanis]|nr:hypothetical protein EAS68_08900 [Legionella jordanis]
MHSNRCMTMNAFLISRLLADFADLSARTLFNLCISCYQHLLNNPERKHLYAATAFYLGIR